MPSINIHCIPICVTVTILRYTKSRPRKFEKSNMTPWCNQFITLVFAIICVAIDNAFSNPIEGEYNNTFYTLIIRFF